MPSKVFSLNIHLKRLSLIHHALQMDSYEQETDREGIPDSHLWNSMLLIRHVLWINSCALEDKQRVVVKWLDIDIGKGIDIDMDVDIDWDLHIDIDIDLDIDIDKGIDIYIDIDKSHVETTTRWSIDLVCRLKLHIIKYPFVECPICHLHYISRLSITISLKKIFFCRLLIYQYRLQIDDTNGKLKCLIVFWLKSNPCQ